VVTGLAGATTDGVVVATLCVGTLVAAAIGLPALGGAALISGPTRLAAFCVGALITGGRLPACLVEATAGATTLLADAATPAGARLSDVRECLTVSLTDTASLAPVRPVGTAGGLTADGANAAGWLAAAVATVATVAVLLITAVMGASAAA
jgi:hypothetical protein